MAISEHEMRRTLMCVLESNRKIRIGGIRLAFVVRFNNLEGMTVGSDQKLFHVTNVLKVNQNLRVSMQIKAST